MMKLVDMRDSKSLALGRVGSSPTSGTTLKIWDCVNFLFYSLDKKLEVLISFFNT